MDISTPYIAGFFDGEGCISSQAYYQPGKYKKNPRIALQVSITNTNLEILQQINEMYGGVVYLHSVPNNTPCYIWKVAGKQTMKRFLEDLLPYLILKRAEAILGLQYIDTVREDNLGPVALDEDVHILRREIHEKLRKRKSLKSHISLRAGLR